MEFIRFFFRRRIDKNQLVDPESYDISAVRLWGECSSSELQVHKDDRDNHEPAIVERSLRSNELEPHDRIITNLSMYWTA